MVSDGTDLTIVTSGVLELSGSTVGIPDDRKLTFGDGAEAYIRYTETADNLLTISGSATGMVLSGSLVRVDTSAMIVGKHDVDGLAEDHVELVVVAETNDDAALSLVEQISGDITPAFGEAGVYGFQWTYDGSDNKLYLKTGEGTSVSTALTVSRATEEITVPDDKKLYFGDSNESYIQYTETSDNFLTISGSQAGLVLSGSRIVIDGTLEGASPLSITGQTLSTGPIVALSHGNSTSVAAGASETFPANTNSLMYGPITISSGATLTIANTAAVKIKDISDL